MRNELLWFLVIVFVGIGITPFFYKPINWGIVLYGIGAAILNVGVLMMK